MIKPRNVALALRMNGAAGRDIMSGVFRFIRNGHHWNIRMIQLPDRLTVDTVRDFERGDTDGIITSELGSDDVCELLAHQHVPLVILGPQNRTVGARKDAIAYVGNDERAIGKTGAEHFLSLGHYNAFGFVPARPGLDWSDERQAGFVEALAKFRTRTSVFVPVAGTGTDADRKALSVWLKGLPKPAGVMAAWDFRATQVLSACQESGLDVPRDVSVLGVDNDELLCELARPRLSSVLPSHELAGYEAAAELNRLMSSSARRRHCHTMTIRPRQVVDRETTLPLAPSVSLVNRALAFIDQQADKGISVRDVVAYLGVSRRLADLRFQEILHRSILETITLKRLEKVTHLLTDTQVPVGRIAARCGFSSVKRLQTVFRARYGMSMRDFRGA